MEDKSTPSSAVTIAGQLFLDSDSALIDIRGHARSSGKDVDANGDVHTHSNTAFHHTVRGVNDVINAA